MRKTKIIITVCTAVAVLLCLFPFPQRLRDGGTTVLKPILPIYEAYIYNAEEADETGDVTYKKGCGIYLFGNEIYENTYYANE